MGLGYITEKLTELALDARENIRQHGWYQASRWLVETLVTLPYSHVEFTLFTRSLVEPLPITEPRHPVILRLATRDDLERFQGLVPPSELRRWGQRLAHGRYCFLALDGTSEDLAAYCWATMQVALEIERWMMRLQPGDTYVYNAYTVPAYRRQGVQTAVHLYRLEYMRSLGCQRAVLIVDDKNIASQRLVRTLGYQEADHLTFRRILWKRSYHYHLGKF
jgi:ribosomal protein S18 acetylase RimI-like enzyme